ncbi:hypothetical protein RvY_16410-2 [Ramazzottius varieornatus]|uniref:tRNA selenocysteine-associated protein 1 n=1 Tax=Ramazzottius varieornatus TaxID=947166 RepID=A0A1D1W5W8_RAMVA|nr:hypothetical protein RvY_16410-2 [Ramazzottius varieornatus]
MATNVLWVGDLDVMHDEYFLRAALGTFGESVLSIKIIKNKQTGLSQGYGFIEFRDDGTALKCLHSLNGKPMSGILPIKRWKLNMAHQGRDNPLVPDFAIFIGDLEYSVDDLQLFNFFSARYSSVKSARVVVDEHGDSRGYGFVRFAEELDQQRALNEMQGVTISNKPIRVSIAAPKNKLGQTPEQQAQMSSEQLANYYAQYVQYQAYYQQWQQQMSTNYEQYYKQYYPGYYGQPQAQQQAVPQQHLHMQAQQQQQHFPGQYPVSQMQQPQAAPVIQQAQAGLLRTPGAQVVDEGNKLVPHDQTKVDSSLQSARKFIEKSYAIDRSYSDVWWKRPGVELL